MLFVVIVRYCCAMVSIVGASRAVTSLILLARSRGEGGRKTVDYNGVQSTVGRKLATTRSRGRRRSAVYRVGS